MPADIAKYAEEAKTAKVRTWVAESLKRSCDVGVLSTVVAAQEVSLSLRICRQAEGCWPLT